MVEKMRTIVSSLNELIVQMLKCRKNRGVTGFLPPPGGPIAASNWTSTSVILDVSFKSYLQNKLQCNIYIVTDVTHLSQLRCICITEYSPHNICTLKIGIIYYVLYFVYVFHSFKDKQTKYKENLQKPNS